MQLSSYKQLVHNHSLLAVLLGLLCTVFLFTLSTTAALANKSPVSNTGTKPSTSGHELPDHVIRRFGTPPEIPVGGLSNKLINALDTAFGDNLKSGMWGAEQAKAIDTIAESKDARLAWLLSDLMRVAASNDLRSQLAQSASELLNITYENDDIWGHTTNQLIGWDIPAPPDYLKYKRNIYTPIVPEWLALFNEGDIDWRHVSWGGVRIDNRPYNTTDDPCNCIPAADNPDVVKASEADWLKNDAVIFGIEVNGEYRAYPRQIMEVREMVNDTLGGRDLGIPYCTLCASAQAYLTDDLPDGVERPILRTSGLLIRSNKVMYDLKTFSIFDTFRGHAVVGELAEKKVKLKQTNVVTTTWGDWKAAHPTTTVLAESLTLGRDFDFRNGRDANGPIFPIGDVDPRLPVQEDIVGLVTESGEPVAFQLSEAIKALNNNEVVQFENVTLVLDGGGVKAKDVNGIALGSHQAFWFAWSQFYPETTLWPM